MRRTEVFFTLALVLGTVSAGASPLSKEPVFRGEYFYNFKNSKSDMSKAMLPANSRGEQWGISYVVVRGKLGPEGRFGGQGRCKRVLEVTEILEVKNKRRRK